MKSAAMKRRNNKAVTPRSHGNSNFCLWNKEKTRENAGGEEKEKERKESASFEYTRIITSASQSSSLVLF
jgi:hypothetical protein